MLDLKEQNKNLCFEDSVLKPISLYMYGWVKEDTHELGGYYSLYKVLSDTIQLESAENTEGILESGSFCIGSMCIPEIKIKWSNDGVKYSNCICVPVQQIGDEYIAYFIGRIIEEKVSKDGTTVSAKIVPTADLEKDVRYALMGQRDLTVLNIVEKVVEAVGGLDFDPSFVKNHYANQNISVSRLAGHNLPQTLTAQECLKNCAEVLGTHIKFSTKQVVTLSELQNGAMATRKNKIDFVRIPKIPDYQPPTETVSVFGGKYTPLEYIQSVGGEGIDTGVVPNKNTRVVMEYAFTGIKQSCLFGSMSIQSNSAFRFGISSTGYIFDAYGTQAYGSLRKADYERHTIDKDGDVTRYDDGTFQEFSGDELYDIVAPLKIGACGISEGLENHLPCYAKIYSCQIYDNGAIIRDYIPCINNSDGTCGLYDSVGDKFYGGNFIFVEPQAVSYTLPYYIDITVEQAQVMSYNSVCLHHINEETSESDPLQVKFFDESNGETIKEYNIPENFLFSTLSREDKLIAIRDIGKYVCGLNYYNCQLQYTYAPFIEPNELIVCTKILNPGKVNLPSGYFALQYIDMFSPGVVTDITPESDKIDISISFEFLGGYTNGAIFGADASSDGYDTLKLYASGSELRFDAGYYGGSIRDAAFSIYSVPLNQRINLNISFNNGTVTYDGTYYGSGEANSYNIYTKLSNLAIGDTYEKYRLYSFSYAENGEKLLDMYPCVRESDGQVGLYDFVSGTLYEAQTNVAVKEEIVLPNLLSKAKGIHSIKADVSVNSANYNK